MPFLTLEHPLPQVALCFTTASLIFCKQVNGMIDGLRRRCEVWADAGVVGNPADCMMLAISMLFQWPDIAQLLPLFEVGKGLDQIFEAYFVILRDNLVVVLKTRLPFRRNATISP